MIPHFILKKKQAGSRDSVAHSMYMEYQDKTLSASIFKSYNKTPILTFTYFWFFENQYDLKLKTSTVPYVFIIIDVMPSINCAPP